MAEGTAYSGDAWLIQQLAAASTAAQSKNYVRAIEIYDAIIAKTGNLPAWKRRKQALLQQKATEERNERRDKLKERLEMAQGLASELKSDDALAVLRNISQEDRTWLKALGVSVDKMEGTIREDQTKAVRAKQKGFSLDLGGGATMRFVYISPGTFFMGSPDSEQGRDKSREGPQYEVIITKPFYMGITEVTQAQYEAVMGTNPSKFKGAMNPVDSVNWDEAVEFCRRFSEKTRKNVRLPTEAEWEYACRAGTHTAFSFGDDPDVLGVYSWLKANSDNTTHPVGQKKPNAWGLFDMHGNVWEWCADWYGYPKGAAADPQDAASGTYRVLRGGSWDVSPTGCRSANRSVGTPVYRYDSCGFRVVVIESTPTVPVPPAPTSPAVTPAPVPAPAAVVVSAQSAPAQAPPVLAAQANELSLGIIYGVTMRFVYIPPGTFFMGSSDYDKNRLGDETPRHPVTLTAGFYMAVTEITQEQYQAVMGQNPSRFKDPKKPVEMVSWADATEFCRKISEKTGRKARLPTEAEWEYACRAGTTTAFSFGGADRTLGDYAWYNDNSGGQPHPVGQKKPNVWGLYDMHGNVWEWCSDRSGQYPNSPVVDPAGPGSGECRVQRGGACNNNPNIQRSASRGSSLPLNSDIYTGFRVVVESAATVLVQAPPTPAPAMTAATPAPAPVALTPPIATQPPKSAPTVPVKVPPPKNTASQANTLTRPFAVTAVGNTPFIVGPVHAGEKYQIHFNTGPNDTWTTDISRPPSSPLDAGGPGGRRMKVVVGRNSPPQPPPTQAMRLLHVDILPGGKSLPKPPTVEEAWKQWHADAVINVAVSTQDQTIEIKVDGWMIMMVNEGNPYGGNGSNNAGTVTGTITKILPEAPAPASPPKKEAPTTASSAVVVSPLPTSGIRDIVVEALIDGDSEFWVTPKGVYWKSLGVGKPGRHQDRNEPTWINGKSWMPEWGKPSEYRGRDETKPLPLPVGTTNFRLELQAVGGEKGCQGIQNRDPVTLRSEGENQVVSIPDSQRDSRWYRFRLYRSEGK